MVVGEFTQDVEILVIGAGPAGIEAARRASELGKQTALVDPEPIVPIPGVEYLQGAVRFADKRSAQITGEQVSRIRFKRAITCTGCRMGPTVLQGLEATRSWREPGSGRVLIAGAGTLAVTAAMRNAHAGAEVVLACPGTGLLPGFDPIIASVVVEHLTTNQVDLLPDVDFAGVTQDSDAALIVLDEGTVLGEFEMIIPAQPLGGQVEGLDLQNTAVSLDAEGWITINDAAATGENRILAAGSVTGRMFEPAAAAHHGRVAAEAACGLDVTWDPIAIPAFLETPVPVSWCGLNEALAAEQGHQVSTIGVGDEKVVVRLVHDRESGLLLGAGAAGPAARRVGEATVVALEMGATVEDLAAMTPVAVDQPGLAEAARAAWKLPS
ncbi:MAG: FAD-dependent oxidoreductase [Planctomycetota bacterium]|nr:FAD-dependent oxidoreductase [Planctomycetota bacterium]